MILDTCDHMGTYRALPGMEKIIAYLAEHDLASMPEGTYEIDGQNLYVMVQNPTLKDPKGAEPEAHKLYADLQLVLSGSEYMGYAPLASLGDPCGIPRERTSPFTGDPSPPSAYRRGALPSSFRRMPTHRAFWEREPGRRTRRPFSRSGSERHESHQKNACRRRALQGKA